jgi:hypothetical protein
MTSHILKVGDPISVWHGVSNPDLREGVVTEITLAEDTILDGTNVPAILWDSINRNDVAVCYKTTDSTPAHNFWAYGSQLVRPE